MAVSAQTWASIQSGSVCVQLACAKVKLDAPSTATKICAIPDFAGEPIDDDLHAVARVVDEQSLPRRMRLPHRRRQRLLERAIELTKAAVAVPARMGGNVFVPDVLQRDVFALQLAVNCRPVRLGVKSTAVASPAENFRRMISRASRMGTLSAGIVCSLGTTKGANLTQASGGARRRVRPRAASFRSGGPHHLVMGGRHHSVATGDIISFWWAASPGSI